MDLSDKILKKEELNNFIFSLKEKVFAPVSDEGLVFFKEVLEIPSLTYQNTSIPLKSLFLPQREELFAIKLKKNDIEILENLINEKKVIFGARPCDCKALLLLDKVFLEEPKDPFYLKRRENTILISLLCKEPGDFCFCTSFTEGSDILMIELESSFYLNVLTEKGEAITKHLKNPSDIEKNEAENKMKLDVKKSILQDEIKFSFEDPRLKELSLKCLGCGICTYLCPTCHCFDIQDEKDVRFRCWDSCSFSFFTKMPSHQPRKEQFQRFRNRILHKFSYFKERFGEYACVGCGRCLKHCPVCMDIMDIIYQKT